MNERDLPPFAPHEPHEIRGDHPGDFDIFNIVEVEGVDTSDFKKANKAVDDHLKNNPEIVEKAQSQGEDVLKRISKRAWIITGLTIAGVAAGIGAKVIYDHTKEKKRQKDES
jgi:hypothetical protein